MNLEHSVRVADSPDGLARLYPFTTSIDLDCTPHRRRSPSDNASRGSPITHAGFTRARNVVDPMHHDMSGCWPRRGTG
jgi:hypothetical protein